MAKKDKNINKLKKQIMDQDSRLALFEQRQKYQMGLQVDSLRQNVQGTLNDIYDQVANGVGDIYEFNNLQIDK